MEASSNKGGLAPIDIKKLVNQIFARRGAPDVKNFAKEFADGSKSPPQTWEFFHILKTHTTAL